MERAEAFFRRCAAEFGTILSRGGEFYASQALYRRYAAAIEHDSTFTVNLSALPTSHAVGDRFYISARQRVTDCRGAKLEVYERQSDFVTYEVTPTAKEILLRA